MKKVYTHILNLLFFHIFLRKKSISLFSILVLFIFTIPSISAQTDSLNIDSTKVNNIDSLTPKATKKLLNNFSNLRTKKITYSSEWQSIDTLTILPRSILIFDENKKIVDKNLYKIRNDSIQLSHNIIDKKQSFSIQYRVLDYNLSAPISRFDSTQIIFDTDGIIIGFDYDIYAEEKAIVDFKGLNYRGNFSRGISFGNTQNLVLNSNFNLQMAGEIGDGIEVLAAITDENIPLQPEGNTQQLSEFDKIFIQLKKGGNKLIAGDYELKRPDSYFMNYYKKLQGVTFSNQSKILKNKAVLENKISAAIARGKFARNTLINQEGNQGPYKLEGSAGERFIIVLSGTEKVFWDGQLLTRGLENDYSIDYNQGIITFTQRRLVTKDIRIIVEFEYSDQNYLRSLAVSNTEFKYGKIRTYLNAYTEQDNKSNSTTGLLSELEINTLRNAGNTQENIFLEPSINRIEGGFDEFRILYSYQDTLINCDGEIFVDSILVYSTNPETALYSANFIEVSQGEGDYIKCDTCSLGANGDIFKWISPDNTCASQGNYRSARRLIPPEQRQLFTAGMDYQISKKGILKTEFSFSRNQLNRFSQEANATNQGAATFVDWQQEIALKSDTSGWTMLTKINYEFKQDRFLALNPYRKAEFKRDWNISTENTTSVNEQLGNAGITILKKNFGEWGYQFSTFLRQNDYEGFKQFSQIKIKKNNWKIQANGSYLETKGSFENTTFFRPKGTLIKTIEKLNDWEIGIEAEREKNERRALDEQGIEVDSLNEMSFLFDRWRMFVASPKSKKSNLLISYSERKDFSPTKNIFSQSTHAKEISLQGNWKQGRTSGLSYNFTYRELIIKDTLLTEQQAAETYLGRADYNFGLWKGVIQSNTGYEVGSGQEQKIRFQYLEVAPGQGNFQWRDYNNDEIVQVNEVENFVFQDSANIQRVIIYTDEFIRVNKVQFNQSLVINPRSIWFKQKGMKGFLSKFSSKSTLQILRKVRVNDEVSPYNPFQLSVGDTSLVAVSSVINNNLFFNRSNQKLGAQYTNTDKRQKRVLNTGFESSSASENSLTLRWNITKKIGIKTSFSKGIKAQDSEFFNNKDYFINYVDIKPKLTWQPNKKFNIVVAYVYRDGKNTLLESAMESALSNDFNLEFALKKASKSTIRAKVSWVNIQYIGSPNSPVGFALLNGLQPGQNYLWGITFDRQISKSLRLNLSYDGRKTGESNIAHVGRAQISATF